jgi:hypothetical protein
MHPPEAAAARKVLSRVNPLSSPYLSATLVSSLRSYAWSHDGGPYFLF